MIMNITINDDIRLLIDSLNKNRDSFKKGLIDNYEEYLYDKVRQIDNLL